MIDALLKLAMAYMLGSLMGGLIIGQLRGHVDIRTEGSGNAGATNAWRTQGPAFGLAVFVIDIGKGVLAALLVPALPLPFLTPSEALASWLPYACGLAAIMGHLYPLFFGFRGGKGAATMIGIMLCLVPAIMPLAGMVWLSTLLITGMMGLATILGTLTIAILTNMHGMFTPAAVFGLLAFIIVLYSHRENIRRMRAGTENRFEKIRIAHWFGGGRRSK